MRFAAIFIVLVSCAHAPARHDVALSPACSSGTARVVASGLAFHPSCMTFDAGTDVTITFENSDRGVEHNMELLPMPFGYNTPSKPLFFGAIVRGPRTVVYKIGAMPAGYLFLVCYVHHDVMFGTYGVAPNVFPLSPHRVHVLWARSNPRGLRWDVQVRRPGKAWTTWRRDVATTSADFVTGKGRYLFRAGLVGSSGVLGWSPVASVGP